MASFLIEDSMMRQGLNLKGCELLLFALIFSYCKKGLTMYESEQSLSERLSYSREQIGKALASLVAQGLVIRSKAKHPHRQSYDYCIDTTKVQEMLAASCEESSQPDVKKPDTREGGNFTASCEERSHNNISDNRINNGEDKGRPRSPFRYIIMNNIWNTLIEEPKWKDKTANSLRVFIDMLNAQKPPVALEMMKYTLSHEYKAIFEPNKDVLARGMSAPGAFYEKENEVRRPRCRKMLDELGALMPEELRPYLPSLSGCRIDEGGARITCPDAVMEWIETNSSDTFPILTRWTMGLRLYYHRTIGNQ